MKLWNAVLKDHGLSSGNIIRGLTLGSYGPRQTCFIVPVRASGDAEIDENAWALQPTSSGKPQIVANRDPSPGMLALLTSYNRHGICLGRIYVLDTGSLDQIMVVGYGIGGNPTGAVTWDEALVLVAGEAEAHFYLTNVGPPDSLVHITQQEVTVESLSPHEAQERIDGEMIRIDDPRLPRWNKKRKE